MSFIDQIRDVAARSKIALNSALTEEATKTSVILPLIRAFGFDVFDLNEVVPEFISDVGTKKGEKVDFALKINGKIVALIEVKPISASLGNVQYNQLYRYFSVTEARLAVLTNGREIWFFSDTDAKNIMDKKPFFKFDLNNFDDRDVAELSKFHKGDFDIENILEAASNLKYANAAAAYIKDQLASPGEEFTKLVARQIYDGSITKGVVELMKPAIVAALDNVIRDRIQEKLGVTFQPPKAEERPASTSDTEGDIQTTADETQAFLIVRAIGAKLLDVNRITIRDAKTYCSVFVDDNNRKPICRFYFNAKSVRHIGIFDASKTETRHELKSLGEIYVHAPQIEAAITAYA